MAVDLRRRVGRVKPSDRHAVFPLVILRMGPLRLPLNFQTMAYIRLKAWSLKLYLIKDLTATVVFPYACGVKLAMVGAV